ncbi:MAG: tRNA (adenosine(37)-N6)-threonylcarbamoyltransferase complex ATPase subunit type 1 TsaE [Nitrospira sp.]|nr:tRNA (adenosine(37)-N6)-threonylcarbamoyltransferase complex ATPase subunit type 1 TsaE [Nitrospira sp.]
MRSRQSPANRQRQPPAVGATPRRVRASNPVWELASPSPLHTDRLGRALGKTLRGGETLALFGPLGAGKTALVRGIAAGLGAPPTVVSSPTFVFIHEYHGRLPLTHVDLYRVRSTRDAESTGLEEYFSGSTVVAIEWADKGLSLLPQDRLEIQLRHRAVESRTIRLSATGKMSTTLLTEAKQQYARTVTQRRKPLKPKRNASS